jgi:putative ABC transport system permease protein
MNLAAIALRNIRRNRRRSLLSGTAIALSALIIACMFSILAGISEDYRSNVTRYITGHVRLRNREYDANEQLNPLHLSVPGYTGLDERLEALPGVLAAAPRIQFATAIYRDGRTYAGLGLGVDFQRERAVMRPDKAVVRGLLPRMGERELALSVGLAEELGAEVGQRITLFGKNKYLGMSGMTFAVTALVRFPVAGFNRSFFLLPIDTAGRFLKMPGEATEVLLLLTDPRRQDQVAAEANRLLSGAGMSEVRALPAQRIGNWHNLLRLIDSSYNVIALFFFILGTTVIVNTTMMVIFERMREIGTVAALGMTPAQIVTLFFLESLAIAVMAALAGVALALAITAPLSRTGIDMSGPLQGVGFEVSPVIYPRISLRSTLFVFLYSVAVSALASFLPSRRAARIEPVEALRSL